MHWSKFKYIEAILRDYPDYDKYIHDREQELLYPVNMWEDENIGGGRSSDISNPTERKALTIAEDKRLCTLSKYKTAIQESLAESDGKTKEIIEQYYFARPQLKTWAGVAKGAYVSERQCRRLRDAFFKLIDDKLGLP